MICGSRFFAPGVPVSGTAPHRKLHTIRFFTPACLMPAHATHAALSPFWSVANINIPHLTARCSLCGAPYLSPSTKVYNACSVVRRVCESGTYVHLLSLSAGGPTKKKSYTPTQQALVRRPVILQAYPFSFPFPFLHQRLNLIQRSDSHPSVAITDTPPLGCKIAPFTPLRRRPSLVAFGWLGGGLV